MSNTRKTRRPKPALTAEQTRSHAEWNAAAAEAVAQWHAAQAARRESERGAREDAARRAAGQDPRETYDDILRDLEGTGAMYDAYAAMIAGLRAGDYRAASAALTRITQIW